MINKIYFIEGKIKKNIKIHEYANEGFKMVNYTDFILALKETWIGRILHSNTQRTKLLASELNTVRQSWDIWNGLK